MDETALVRSAGWWCIVGALLQIVSGVTVTAVPRLAKTSSDFFRYGAVLFVLIGLSLFVAVLALVRSGAGGSGRLPMIGLGLAFLGWVLFTVGEIAERVAFDAGNAVLGVADPLTGLGLILVGVAVLRAGRWHGPLRLAPLVCGLYIFVVLLPAFAISHGPNYLAVAGWSVCWLLVGVALRSQPIDQPLRVRTGPDPGANVSAS